MPVHGERYCPSTYSTNLLRRKPMAPHWLSDLGTLGRLTQDLRAFVRTPVAAEQAVSMLQRQLETRKERILRLAEQAIYTYQRSTYLNLLRAAVRDQCRGARQDANDYRGVSQGIREACRLVNIRHANIFEKAGFQHQHPRANRACRKACLSL